jgi:hypothetical protein
VRATIFSALALDLVSLVVAVFGGLAGLSVGLAGIAYATWLLVRRRDLWWAITVQAGLLAVPVGLIAAVAILLVIKGGLSAFLEGVRDFEFGF